MAPTAIAIQQLGNAEVEQLDMAVDRDQHVGGLEVAVHDEVGVRVRDRLQDVEKETEACLDPQRVVIAIAVDALTVDVFEDEIGLACWRHAGIDEVRDVRVGEPGEDVAFAPEPLFAGAADQRDVQQLDRGPPLEAPVAALGEPDAAHPTLPDV